MIKLRRLLIIISLLGLIGSTLLFLNITAPNPTHRRYSSRPPIMTGGGSSQDIGLDAERVLSNDLGVPRNDLPDQRQCFGMTRGYAMPSDCRVVISYYPNLTASFRRPDFISSDFVAESKNRLSMPYQERDLLDQIGDYTLVSRTLNKPLWVYVRTDTKVDPEYESLVNSTGGAIVRYFAAVGYTDPVDKAAQYGLVIFGAAFLTVGACELISRRRGGSTGGQHIPVKPHPPTPPDSNRGSSRRRSPDPVGELDAALKRAQEAARHTRNKLD